MNFINLRDKINNETFLNFLETIELEILVNKKKSENITIKICNEILVSFYNKYLELDIQVNYNDLNKIFNFNKENKHSIYYFGFFYYLGIGCIQNRTNAIKYFEESSEFEHNDAYFYLGYHLKNNMDCSNKLIQNKIFNYFKKASELGNYNGTECLGLCYKDGFGTDIDYYKAIKCFEDIELKNENYLSLHNIVYKEKIINKLTLLLDPLEKNMINIKKVNNTILKHSFDLLNNNGFTKKYYENKWKKYTYTSWIKWVNNKDLDIFLNELNDYIQYNENNTLFRFENFIIINSKKVMKFSNWYDVYDRNDKKIDKKKIAYLAIDYFKNSIEVYQTEYGEKRLIGLLYNHKKHLSKIQKVFRNRHLNTINLFDEESDNDIDTQFNVICHKIPQRKNELGRMYLKNTCRTCGCNHSNLIKGKCKDICGKFYSNPLICPCIKEEKCTKAATGECCNQTWHDLSQKQKEECEIDKKQFDLL